jgi:hypothetical protein
MNSPIVTNSTQQSSSASAYTFLQSMKEGSIPFGPAYNSPSSWRKFLHKSLLHPRAESLITVVVASSESNTAEGPTVPKPQSLLNDYDARIESFLHFLESLEAKAETIENEAAE